MGAFDVRGGQSVRDPLQNSCLRRLPLFIPTDTDVVCRVHLTAKADGYPCIVTFCPLAVSSDLSGFADMHKSIVVVIAHPNALPTISASGIGVTDEQVKEEIEVLATDTRPWAFFMCAGGHFAAAIIAQGKCELRFRSD